MVGLAVTSSERNPVYRAIPTFAEQGYPDVRGETWFWLAGPKNLPAGIVGKLNEEVRRIVQAAQDAGLYRADGAHDPGSSIRPRSPAL